LRPCPGEGPVMASQSAVNMRRMVIGGSCSRFEYSGRRSALACEWKA
jgi:hypothetical protein